MRRRLSAGWACGHARALDGCRIRETLLEHIKATDGALTTAHMAMIQGEQRTALFSALRGFIDDDACAPVTARGRRAKTVCVRHVALPCCSVCVCVYR